MADRNTYGCEHGPGPLSTVGELLKLSACKNDARAKRRETDGEAFNIFDALNLTTDEVNGHSRFLCQLLSPRGSHGMGAAFLRAFFEHMPGLSSEPWLADVRVGREVAFEDGRIDILLELPNVCCVVIEVKIHAADQRLQLKRYSNYLKQWKALNPDALVAEEFYLTLDGREASDFSVGESGTDYTKLSFAEDILPWLESCIKLAASKPRVSETIKQYREIIEGLTRRVSMDEEMACIVDRVSSSQASYEAASQIADSLFFARTKMLKTVFEDIESHLKKGLPGKSDLTTDMERTDVEKYYSRNERRRPCPRIKFKLKEDGERILALIVELTHRWWIGIVYFEQGDNEWEIKRIDRDGQWLYPLSSKANAGIWERMIESAPEDDWWLDWRFIESGSREKAGCVDFRHCLSSEYSSLFDSANYEAFIERVHKGIDNYLVYLEGLGLLEKVDGSL